MLKEFQTLYEIYESKRDKEMEAFISKTSLQHLSYNHLLYMDAVYQMETPTLSEISDFLELSKPSVTVMVNKLIKENLLEKFQSPVDKRSFQIRLTKNGKAFITYEKDIFMETVGQVFKSLTDEEIILLKALLRKGLKEFK